MGRRDRLKERLSKVFGSGTSNETDTADSKGHQLRRRQVGSSGLNDPPDGVTGLDESPENFKGRLIQDTPIRELWNVAYEKLREEDGTLIANYEAKLTGSVTAGIGQSLHSNKNRREWMQAILSSKMDEVNKNNSKLESGNFTTQAKDAMQLLLKIINSAKEYIGNAASANPYTSIAWAGISFLLPLLMNMSEEEASLAKGLDYTASLIVQSRMREELYFECYESGTHSHERFRQSHTQYKMALERLYIYILRFQATACYHYSKSSALRHGLDAVKWKDWAPLVDEVREQERNFAAVEELWRDIQRYTEHLTTVKTFSEMNSKLSAIADQEFADLLRWLCNVDPSSLYNAGLDRHEAGTCEWLIKDSEEFKTWETSDGSLLWLHGKAGSGKSILSSSVIKHLRNQYVSEPSTVVSYFYFSFSDAEKQKVDVMLASLIKQICSRQTQKSQLMERLRQYKLKSERPDTETLEAVLIASASEFTKVYIVIDAIDECPLFNEQRGKLLKSLRRILAIAPNKFHFFLTSRREPDIDDKIRPILSSTNKNEIDLLARQQIINRDINHYIDSQLNGDEYKNWPKSVKDEARESLVEKADCMFQYVRLQLEALRSLSSESDIRKALRDLPTGLDATYDRVLESIPPNFQERVIHSLKWLAFSRGVFCIEELAEIFTIPPHDDIPFDEMERPFSPTDILKYFSGLVIVQDDNSSEDSFLEDGFLEDGFSEDSFSEDSFPEHRQSTQTQIRLVHFSLKEYLISKRITEGATLAFSFTEVNAQLSIVRSCLIYLNHLNRWVADQTSDNFDDHTVNKSYPLAEYVTRYWMAHLEEIPRMSWPPDIERDAMSTLAVHSQSLLTLLILSGGDKEDIMKPYCYTAERGHFQLTKMLIYQNSGTNKYITREELDDALQQIAFKGNADMMQVFLEAGADVNVQCGKWGSALYAAAEGGRLDCLRLLVSHGANVNSVSSDIWGECLLTCISKYATDCLQFLLDSGADINMQGRYYTTALHKAVKIGDDASVNLLLDRGANVNVLGNKGTPLQIACKLQPSSWYLMKTRDIARYVKKLLESGADPNLRDGENGTALQLACANRGLFPNYQVALEIVQLLAQNRPVEKGTIIQGFVVKEVGFDRDYIRWRNTDQELAKERPILKPAVEILKLLLEKGGIIEEPLALHMASLRRDEERVRWLLDQGADVNEKLKKSFSAVGTPLHAVLTYIINDEGEARRPYTSSKVSRSKKIISEETIPIVRLLIGKGAQVNDIGGECGTALQAACSNEAFDADMVRFLLELGADVNAEGGKYRTALIAACLNEAFDVDTVRLLLEHGADVNAEGGEYGRTALGAACEFKDLELVRLLLEYGANMHQQDDAAWIAAAWRPLDYDKGIEVLQLLFDHAADMDVNHVDKEHGTALHCMLDAWYDEKRRQTLHEKLCWLLEHGADVNVEGGTYGFALQTACARESEIREITDINAASRTTKFLLERCPDINVNAQGGIFGSALQAAAFSGQTESVNLLLDRGADIDARGGKCGSALNAAIFRGYWDIVEILLQKGATPDYRLRQQPDEEWLQRVREEWSDEVKDKRRKREREADYRCAIARYRKFWEVESGSTAKTE